MNMKKQNTINTFNDVCERYDNPDLKFFTTSSKSMAELMKLKGDEKVLDVATGTGNTALEIAKRLPGGEVVGVDFSSGMLGVAREKAKYCKINNIKFMEMDIEAMDFPRCCFDAATCSFGIFFVDDMKSLLEKTASKVKKGGKVMVSTFADGFIKPQVELYRARLKKYGAVMPEKMPSQLVATKEQCIELFKNAGLKDVKVTQQQHGYFVKNAQNWWNLIHGAALSGFIKQIPQDKLAAFKKEHLEEIEKLSTKNGLWIEAEILFTEGAVQ